MAGSIELTSTTELISSLREAGIDNILEFLSLKPESDLRLHINQQRGEPELTQIQKVELLRSKLENNPGGFLAQFGKYLLQSHLDCFSSLREINYEVDSCLKQMEISNNKRKLAVKNRRYEALQKLVDTTDYFSEEEMQRRNPILYNQLIGRFHTAEERQAFLASSSLSSSSRQAGCRPTPLTDMLIAHMNRREGICSDRRIDQEHQVLEEKQADKEYVRKKSASADYNNMESDNEEEECENGGESEGEIDESEKELFKEEFFTTMYRSFLEGKDEDFDYENVDDNPDYDVGETMDQDQEEKYFDSEEPQNQNMEINSESKLFSKSNSENEEDELDTYMKSIESEIKKQKKF